MSGRPGDDDAVDLPDMPDMPDTPGLTSGLGAHSASATGAPDGLPTPDQPASPIEGAYDAAMTGPEHWTSASGSAADDERLAEPDAYGQYAWSGDQGERGRFAGLRRPAGRMGSGALLPGDWARADLGSGGSGPVSGADPPGGWRGWLRRRKTREVRGGGLRRGRVALGIAGLALACTLLGGVVGGYIALSTHNSDDAGTSPGYSLGTLPPALTNRPAGSIAGVAARITPSVVMIKVNGGVGTGSGFIIRGGYIVTDNHVVTLDGELHNASIRVYFSNGKSVPGTVVAGDPFSDIAVIRPDGASSLPALSLGNSTSVEVGDPVIAVGSPLGLADTVTSGIVSAVNRPVQPGGSPGQAPQVYFDAIQTDAPINPGSSGGPLVNGRGQVIGIDAAIDTLGNDPMTGSQGGSIGLGFAIPINQARRVTLELIRTGHATHATLGAVINGGWGGNGAQIVPVKPGRRSSVTPGGPAAKAGLLPGDVITSFAGQTVNNANTLLDAVRSMPPGARTSVTFVRAGQAHTVSLRLGSAQS